eukprot:scaffold5731_cov108-Skeletonema_dohrnii-CCMP3373.AAC.1
MHLKVPPSHHPRARALTKNVPILSTDQEDLPPPTHERMLMPKEIMNECANGSRLCQCDQVFSLKKISCCTE